MNTSLLFENLTIEEFNQILHSIAVPKLVIPLKEDSVKYFNKEIPVLSLSRKAIEEVYVKLVYKKVKDTTLALHLTNQVIDLINQDGLSDQYALLLRKKHNHQLDEEYHATIKNINNQKVNIDINAFFKMLGEEEDTFLNDEDKNKVEEQIIEEEEIIDEEGIIDEEEIIEDMKEDIVQEIIDPILPSQEIVKEEIIDETQEITNNQEEDDDIIPLSNDMENDIQELSIKSKSEDLFKTMDYIDKTIENFRNEINQLKENEKDQEDLDINSEKYQNLIKEKSILSMELNRNRIKILTLESQLDQAIYSMKAYAKRVEDIVEEYIGKQEIPKESPKDKVASAMNLIQQYQIKYNIPGHVSIDELWVELSKAEEELLTRLVKDKKDLSENDFKSLNRQLQETFKVKEAIQLLLLTNH